MSRKTEKIAEKENKEQEKRCSRCLRMLNWIETESGELKLWCYYCQAPLLGQSFYIIDKDMPG